MIRGAVPPGPLWDLMNCHYGKEEGMKKLSGRQTLLKKRLKPVLGLILLFTFTLSGCVNKNFEAYRPITDINNLEGRKIGVSIGWSADYLLSGREDMLLYRYDTVADMLVALCYKKIDAIAVESVNAGYVLALTSGLEKVEPDLYTESYVGIFTGKNEEICEEFNAWISEYKKTEEYANLAERYRNFDGSSYEWPFEEEITEGKELRMGTYADSYPCAYYDINEGTIGFELEFFYAFCRDNGYKPVVTATTEDDIYMGLTYDRYDCHFGCYSQLYSYEIANSGYAITDPYMELPIVFIEIGDADNLSISKDIDIMDE